MLTTIVVLPLASDGRVLTSNHGNEIRLPTLRTEMDREDESPIAHLRGALRDELGFDPPVLELYRPAQSGVEEPTTMLLVVEPPAGPLPPARGWDWQPASSVNASTLDPSIRARTAQWLGEASGTSPVPALRAAWSRLGWHSRATSWLDDALASVGRERTGPVEQKRLWGISVLLRAATDRGQVWLKGAYPPFAAEPRITRRLAARFPGSVPSVLATNEDQGWTLLDDFGGALVGENRGGPVGTAAIATLASIQQGLAGNVAELVEAGAVIRPLDGLVNAVRDAFEEAIGPKPWRQPVERREELVERLQLAVERVDHLEMRPSLVHGDFHSWNVADVAGRPLIFDWTDAAISHPLVDFGTWVGWIDDPAERARMFEPWVAAWESVVPAADLRRLHAEILAVGAAYQVVSYVGIVRTLEAELGPQVAGGAVAFANLMEDALDPGR